MKNILYIAAVTLLCSSCFHVNSNWTGGKNAIKGEGEVVSKTLDLKDFDQIVINGHADVDFTQTSGYEVTVKTQENIFEWLDYKVDGTTLIIETKDHREIRATEYDIVIQAPELKKLTVNGASDFSIDALRMDGDLDVQVNGAGDLDFNRITCNSFTVEVNGAADANLTSIDILKSLTVKVNGAGDVNAKGLKVKGEVSKHTSGLAKIQL